MKVEWMDLLITLEGYVDFDVEIGKQVLMAL